MVIKHYVKGYDNFCKFIENFDSKGQLVHIYFGGSKLPSGESWCDDCVRGELGYVYFLLLKYLRLNLFCVPYFLIVQFT
jgi:hypothetical protein